MGYIEEVYRISNYLKPSPQILRFNKNVQASLGLDRITLAESNVVSDYDRSYGIQKIYDLHAKKEYKPETLFIAASIFDRYIHTIGVSAVPKTDVVSLSVISTLMAAKLEQPVSPSFQRMINLLTAEEKPFTSKEKLVEMEATILYVLGFDFTVPTPIQFVERFMRMLGYQNSRTIFEISYQICKF
jgi:hypothetical protein